jgi:hypothetical protein
LAKEYDLEDLLRIVAPSDEEIIKVVDDARRDARYVVADYPVELLVSKFTDDPKEEGDIYIPDYQRTLRWPERSQAYFVESVILRIPIPPIFFYDVQGKFEVVDGSQRVRTLARFAVGDLELADLEKLEILNGMRFHDMPTAIQKRFNNTPIRSFVLDEGTDETTRIELFRRLNTTGKKLHDSEIRKGAYRGPFLALILECADSAVFRELTPRISKASDADSERQELVTRFFIYGDHYLEFKHDVRKFLDKHIIDLNLADDAQLMGQMKKKFNKTMEFVSKNFPHGFYRTEHGGTLPRVRFEAVAIGASLALQDRPNLRVTNTDWLWGPELNALVRTDASNSGPKLRQRIEYVRDRLLGP